MWQCSPKPYRMHGRATLLQPRPLRTSGLHSPMAALATVALCCTATWAEAASARAAVLLLSMHFARTLHTTYLVHCTTRKTHHSCLWVRSYCFVRSHARTLVARVQPAMTSSPSFLSNSDKDPHAQFESSCAAVRQLPRCVCFTLLSILVAHPISANGKSLPCLRPHIQAWLPDWIPACPSPVGPPTTQSPIRNGWTGTIPLSSSCRQSAVVG